MSNPITGGGELARSRQRRAALVAVVATTMASGLYVACGSPPMHQPPNCIRFESNPWSIPPASAGWSGCCYHKDDPSRLGTVVIDTLPTGAKRARCNF